MSELLQIHEGLSVGRATPAYSADVQGHSHTCVTTLGSNDEPLLHPLQVEAHILLPSGVKSQG